MAEDSPSDAAENRWTVRGVGTSYRKAAADAAERADISVGAWLCRAIELAINAEREPIEVLAPADAPADKPKKARASFDREKLLALTVPAVAAAVQLADAKGVPDDLRAQLEDALRKIVPPVRKKAMNRALPPPGA